MARTQTAPRLPTARLIAGPFLGRLLASIGHRLGLRARKRTDGNQRNSVAFFSTHTVPVDGRWIDHRVPKSAKRLKSLLIRASSGAGIIEIISRSVRSRRARVSRETRSANTCAWIPLAKFNIPDRPSQLSCWTLTPTNCRVCYDKRKGSRASRSGRSNNFTPTCRS
jgi:hypothetical protein